VNSWVKVVEQGPIEQLPLPHELPSRNWPSPSPSIPCRRERGNNNNNKNQNCGKRFIHEISEDEQIKIKVPLGTPLFKTQTILGERQ
jgi:hypothetical protein